MPDIQFESTDVPKAVGPYSQAIKAGDLIFVSGQIGIMPSTGRVVEEGVVAQSRQIFRNIKAILRDEGCTMEQIVKCEVYLKNISDFQPVNAVFAEVFTKGTKPARHTVQVVGLPMGAMIEIACVAYAGK